MLVTLYTTTTCHECIPIKKLLDENSIEYRELLVDRDNNAAKEMVKKSGQSSVPVLVIKKNDTEEVLAQAELSEIAEKILQ